MRHARHRLPLGRHFAPFKRTNRAPSVGPSSPAVKIAAIAVVLFSTIDITLIDLQLDFFGEPSCQQEKDGKNAPDMPFQPNTETASASDVVPSFDQAPASPQTAESHAPLSGKRDEHLTGSVGYIAKADDAGNGTLEYVMISVSNTGYTDVTLDSIIAEYPDGTRRGFTTLAECTASYGKGDPVAVRGYRLASGSKTRFLVEPDEFYLVFGVQFSRTDTIGLQVVTQGGGTFDLATPNGGFNLGGLKPSVTNVCEFPREVVA